MKVVVALIAVALVGVASCATLPTKLSNFNEPRETCYRNRPNINPCLRKAIQDSLSILIERHEEFGVPSIDPHKIDMIPWDFSNGSLEGLFLMSDIVTYGFNNATISDVESDFEYEDLTNFLVVVHIPHLKVLGKYKFYGKLLEATLNTGGDFQVSLKNIRAVFDVDGVRRDKNEEEYMEITNVIVYPEIEEMKLNASNVFRKNPELSKFIIDEFNNHWRTVLGETITAEIKDQWSNLVKKIGNSVLLKVPFNKLFPLAP